MKKNYFLMLMALVFLLVGCRTENMNDESVSSNVGNKFQLSSKRISLAESKHKLKLISEISETTTFLKSKVSGKTTNNISIDTDHVIYIENGPNYHTYTFNITRENASENAPVENLVLTPLPDGSYKGLIFSYNFTQQEKQKILNGIPVDTKGKTTIYEAEGNFNTSKVSECNYVEETIWQDCSQHIHNQSNFGDWINCTAEIKPQVYTIGYWSCSSGGGGSENGSGNTGSEDGTGGGNAGNENCITEVFQNPLDPVGVYNPCPIGVPTMPTFSGNFSLYVNSLPLELKNLLNNNANSDFYNGLSNYFYTNNGSNDAKIFIAWAAQFKLNSPTTTWEQFQNWFIDPNGNPNITFDSSLNINNARILTMQEFKNLLEQTKTFSIDQQNDTTTKIKYDIQGVFGGVNVFLNHSKINNKYIGSSVSSSEYGFTLTWSWTENNNSIDTTNNLFNQFDLFGTVNSNFIIEGIGTVYKTPFHLRFRTLKSNGSCYFYNEIKN